MIRILVVLNHIIVECFIKYLCKIHRFEVSVYYCDNSSKTSIGLVDLLVSSITTNDKFNLIIMILKFCFGWILILLTF